MHSPHPSACASFAAAILTVCMLLTEVSANTISLNFVRASGGETPLASFDTAGVVPVGNWNNAPQANANSHSNFALVDNSGAASGATASWQSGGATFSVATTGSGGAADKKMMTGYLDQSGNGLNQIHTVTVSNIPYANYDVYLYHSSSGGANRTARYRANTVDLFTRNLGTTNTFNGFVQNQHATLAAANASGTGGNYVKWSNLSGTLSIETQGIGASEGGYPGSDDTRRAPVQGIQIVKVIVTPGLPQVVSLPATSVTSNATNANGDLLDNGLGADAATLTFYWGTTDGGILSGAWTNSTAGGTRTAPGNFTTALSALLPNTRYYYRTFASNSVGNDWAPSSETFTTPAALPTVENTAASAVLATTATIGGSVTTTGGDTPTLVIYYGDDDAGTTNNWDNQLTLGAQNAQASGSISSLSPNTTYYFRAAATNAAGTAWASISSSFTTLIATVPAVSNTAATSVGGISATLNGSVTSTGNDPPFITFYYGTSDGGNVPGNWESSLAVGNQAASVSRSVTNLAPLTTYYFRAFAQNAAGQIWASPSLSFTTTAYVPPPIVINEIHYDENDPTVKAEFIELYNNATEAIALTDWQISSGVAFAFPSGTVIQPGAYLVIAQNPAVIQSKFGHSAALGPWTGNLRSSGETIELKDSAGNVIEEVSYNLGFPWPTVGDLVGSPLASPSIQLINPLLDVDLGGSWRSASPTPGAQNTPFSLTAPPQIRQVTHLSEQPTSAQNVVISAKITDPEGVSSATLSYQLVEPGDYIKRSDPRYATSWTSLPMHDDGINGDTLAGDSIFSVTLPGTLQTHRRLVRYRISATDNGSASITTPYADDPQPNFAYYVYDAIPAYTAKATPSDSSVAYNFSTLPPLQQKVAVYQLLTTRQEHEESQHIPNAVSGGYTGSDYLWQGSLVYGGRVYDHIRFRARGGVWRYAMGKNMWKFDFNRGHRFRARNDYGKRYANDWNKLNFSALIQQGNFGQRGEQGLFEAAGFKLHNLTGNTAPNTHFVHFRIVESADQQGSGESQFGTDFQGLYLAVEQYDGQFLKEHELPDGNLYKIEDGSGPGNGELNSLGADMPSDNSDLVAFANAYDNGTPSQSYWEQNLHLDDYYNFYAIITAIHDNDIHAGKNFFFFHRPVDPLDPHSNKWQALNWDLDLCWTTTYRQTSAPDDEIDQDVFVHADLQRDYRNRMREIRDLLFNPHQTGMILDEVAQFVYTPGQPSYVDADRAMWDYNPILTSSYADSSKLARYYAGATPQTFAGMVQHVKNYITTRSAYIDISILTDENAVPAKPVLTYTGLPNYPANTIAASCSNYSSPGGTAFTAMEWRLGAITNTAAPDFDPAIPRKYEIDAIWESGEITTFAANITVPTAYVRPGETYRLRARFKDSAGRWGHWSTPIEFTATAPDVTPYQQALVISEIMYNPPEPSGAELAVSAENDDYEFIELKNVSSSAIDLTGVRFTKGVDFDFPDGTMLEAGARILAVKNITAFEARYGTELPVAGTYGTDNLSNGGEQLKLALGAGTTVRDFTYSDSAPWPTAADGAGYSLVLKNPVSLPDHALASSWRTSATIKGTPGSDDTIDYATWAAANNVTGIETDDDDHDGISNLLEFALASQPGIPSSDDLPQISLVNGFLTLEFTRPTAADSLTYIIEFSEDLINWSDADSLRVNSTPAANSTTTEIWRDTIPQNNTDRRFARLKVLM